MHIKRRFSITKKYSVIYADPPWRYERSKVQGAAEKHYPTMDIDELCVAFVWLKRNRKSPSWFYGMGYWTRSNAEICLLATKGKPKRQSAGVHQFLISPIEQHSKKPDAAREKIVALLGDLPRIELFARQKTPGWDIWGNELPNSIEM